MMLIIIVVILIILFLIPKTQNYPVVTLSAGFNHKLSKIFRKGFERLVYWNEHKTKRDNKKIWQMNISVFPNQILLESTHFLF